MPAPCKPIAVVGGQVWQWDQGRVAAVPQWAERAHFARRGDAQALVVEVRDDGQRAVADVPNELLQEAGTVLAWVVDEDRTVAEAMIPVAARPKPSDYVYTPTEVETVETLKAWVEERISELEETGGIVLGHGLKLVDGAVAVDCAVDVEEDNTLPVTSAAVYVEVGNIEALLATV